jgi:hypothetical protein
MGVVKTRQPITRHREWRIALISADSRVLGFNRSAKFTEKVAFNIISHKLLLRFEVFAAVIMKNVVFWDTKTQFAPHRRHSTSLQQSPAG